MHGVADAVPALGAEKVAQENIGADGEADEHADQETDDRGIAPDGSHGVCAGKAPDDRNVRRVEELLEDAAGGKGHGETEQLPGQRAVKHIEFTAHGRSATPGNKQQVRESSP